MASYLVLTPAGSRPDPMAVRFVRDGFSLTAFLIPLVWMLYHRMWLPALLLLGLELALGAVIEMTGATTAGTLVGLALMLLIALESGQLRAMQLMARGWTYTDVVVADRLDTAEDIYFSGNEGETLSQQGPAPRLSPAIAAASSASSGPALGLFDYGKGR